MTTPIPATRFAGPAPAQRLEQAAAALRSHGFTAELHPGRGTVLLLREAIGF